MKGDPLEIIKKICEKMSHQAKKPAQINFGRGRDSNLRPSA